MTVVAVDARKSFGSRKTGRAPPAKNTSKRDLSPDTAVAASTVAVSVSGVNATVEGDIISVTDAGVVGWAWDPANPRRAISVAIMHGDETIGVGIANIFDHELVRQRAGRGIPGFLVKPTRQPKGKYPVTLTLKVDDGPLLGTPLIIDDPAELEVLLSGTETALYDGNVDFLQDGAVIGWIWSPDFPNHRVPVEIWDGEERIDRTVASTYREDLVSLTKGDGYYGFRLELPLSLLDGRHHALRVRVPNSQYEIPGGAINFGPMAVSALMNELAGLRTEVAGLSKLINQVTSPHGEFQGAVIRTLSERLAALAEIQRETVERELDALRAFAFDPANEPTTVIAPEARPPLESNIATREDVSRTSSRPQRTKTSSAGKRPSVVAQDNGAPADDLRHSEVVR
jgi:hypothetical protein